MAATLTLRVYTGANAGTQSSAQTALELCDTDALSGGDVAPASNSFERWVRLRVDDAGGQTVSGFWVERAGDLPDGVSIKLGTTDVGQTPTAASSTIARETMAGGRKYYFDAGSYGTTGDLTRYLVLQEIVESGAPSGPIDQQDFTFGWSSEGN